MGMWGPAEGTLATLNVSISAKELSTLHNNCVNSTCSCQWSVPATWRPRPWEQLLQQALGPGSGR